MECKECGYENRQGVLLCENCGTDIYDILVGEVTTKQLSQNDTRDLQLNQPASSRPLILYIADGVAPLSVERKNNQVIGRIDPAKTNDTSVDIDLTVFDALNNGVSRHHARLDAREQPPALVDLGSNNGTYVNGKRLTTDSPEGLESGDEVQVGRLKMRVYFK